MKCFCAIFSLNLSVAASLDEEVSLLKPVLGGESVALLQQQDRPNLLDLKDLGKDDSVLDAPTCKNSQNKAVCPEVGPPKDFQANCARYVTMCGGLQLSSNRSSTGLRDCGEVAMFIRICARKFCCEHNHLYETDDECLATVERIARHLRDDPELHGCQVHNEKHPQNTQKILSYVAQRSCGFFPLNTTTTPTTKQVQKGKLLQIPTGQGLNSQTHAAQQLASQKATLGLLHRTQHNATEGIELEKTVLEKYCDENGGETGCCDACAACTNNDGCIVGETCQIPCAS